MNNQGKNNLKFTISRTLILFVFCFLIQVLTPEMSHANSYTEVTKDEVIQYLESQGFKTIECKEIFRTDDWISTNSDGTRTMVIVEDGRIIGHEIVDF
jgi:coproporphyrinogen III oxidase